MTRQGLLSEAGLQQIYDQDIAALNPLLEQMSARGMPIDEAARVQALAMVEQAQAQCLAQMQALVPEACCKVKVYKKKPSKLVPWIPSPKQLMTYLRFKGLRVPQRAGKDTTAETSLRRLALANPQDQVLPLVLEYRALQNDHGFIKGLKPARDGCVHTAFKHDPSTLRLSSQGPNLQNIPR